MKPGIAASLLVAVPLLCGGGLVAENLARDFHQTEDIINNILSDDSGKTQAVEGEQPAASAGAESNKQDAATPVEGKKAPGNASAAPGRKGSPVKEEIAPRVSGEEQMLLKTGTDFYNNGMYDHSLKKFRELAEKFPQGIYRDTARFWTGMINMKQYRYDDAIKEFSAISPESFDYPAALYYTGESYQMKGDQVTSIEYYQKVYARFPAHRLADKALLNIGMLFLGQKKGGQALDSAVRLIKAYRDRDTVDDAYYLLGQVYEKDPQFRDIETARKIYRQFIRKGETDDRFGKSPLKKRVEADLRRIESVYFKMER
ncbi:MAG: tetratricopeptide repeat protein [Spirochaetes bacterium]|nr:tetratricopeptide repeat protein [Spirochaetota bacterium]